MKIAGVQQGSYVSTIGEKLEAFDKELRSPSISIKKQIRLALLAEPERDDFNEEVGRIYGITSNYVHLSPVQIEQSIAAATAGVTAGKERPEDVCEFNRLAERAMAASLVFLFHSVPSWVAGDWLVESDGSSIEWHFIKSRFVAGMDRASITSTNDKSVSPKFRQDAQQTLDSKSFAKANPLIFYRQAFPRRKYEQNAGGFSWYRPAPSEGPQGVKNGP